MLPKARVEGLLLEEAEDELLVYDQERDKCHCLNRTAAIVFRHCDGETTLGQMVVLLEKDLDILVNEDMVELALDRLEKARLLETELEGGPRYTRRQVMQKMALGGALAALLPVVTTIVAPTPASAATFTCESTPKGFDPRKCQKLLCPVPQKQQCVASKLKRRCECVDFKPPKPEDTPKPEGTPNPEAK